MTAARKGSKGRDRRDEEAAELELRFGLAADGGDYPRERRGFDPEELEVAGGWTGHGLVVEYVGPPLQVDDVPPSEWEIAGLDDGLPPVRLVYAKERPRWRRRRR